MASLSIFGCCTTYEPLQNSQATISSVSRNISGMDRKKKIVNAPKSSLKSLSSVRSFKNLETINQSVMSCQPFATQRQQRLGPKNQNAVTTTMLRVQNPRQIMMQNQVLLTPINRPTSLVVPRQNIRFSYSAQRNNAEINKQTACKNQNEFQFHHKVQQLNRTKQQQRNQQLQKILSNGQHIKELPSLMLDKKRSSLISNISKSKHHQVNKKTHLGNSVFTVTSQDELEEEQAQIQAENQQIKMQQSAIIVNVFNPTKSQMQRWDLQAGNQKKSLIKNK